MNVLRDLADRIEGASRVGIGLLAFAIIVVGFALLWTNTLQLALSPRGEKVKATFASTGSLTKNDEVRVHGVKVGRVTELQLNEDGRSTTIEMEVDDDAQPLHADARAEIRFRTVLGGTAVVNLDPGTPGAGELGDRTIPPQRTDNQVEVDDITGILRDRAKDGLRKLLAELPRALRDERQPAEALGTLADVAPNVDRALEAVRGRRDGDLLRLIRRTGRTVRALDTPTDAIRELVEGGAATFEATARQSAAIRSTLDQAARIQPAARTTLTRLEGTLARVAPLVARLRSVAPQVKPTVDRLHPTLVHADRLLRRARPLLHSLRPAAAALERASRDGIPLVEGIAPSIRRLDDQILPGLAKRSPETRRRTYEMIGPVFAALTGFGSSFDNEGYFGSLNGNVSDRALDTLPCRTYIGDPSEQRLAECESLRHALEQLAKGGRRPR